METKAFRLTILLLAFSIGIAAASLFYFRPAKMASIRSVEVEESGSTTDTGSSLEMVFVIDTTGSMGGLIDGAKQKVWSIVNEVQQRSSHPAVKVGLVAYRDRGDAYIT